MFTKITDDAARAAGDDVSPFPARLVAVDGRRVAQGRDFAATGELRNADLLYLSGTASDTAGQAAQIPPGVVHRLDAGELASRLDGVPFSVKSVERKPRWRPLRAVPHHHAAGGVAQARLLRQVHDVDSTAAV